MFFGGKKYWFVILRIKLKPIFKRWFTSINLLNILAILLLVFAIYWILTGPTRVVEAVANSDGPQQYDFRTNGQIGDTIGGITAPVVGLISAILVYLSFTAQVRANRIIQQESNFKYILEEFEKTKKSFKKFDYKPFGNQFVVSEPYKGHFGIIVFTSDINTSPELINSTSYFVIPTLKKLCNLPLFRTACNYAISNLV